MVGTISDLGGGAIKAGVVAGIVASLGAKELKQAQANYQKSYQDLAQSQTHYLEALNQTAKVGLAYQEAIKAIELLENQKIDYSGLFLQPSTVNLNLLKMAVTPLDKEYQDRVIETGQRLNSLPLAGNDYSTKFYSLANGLLTQSVETRLQGDIDLSEAQISASEEVLDFVVGLDPLSGAVRGLYEAYTGENIVTGQPLDDFQRALTGAFGVLNLTTLGIASCTYTAFKVVQKLYRSSYGSNFAKYLSVSATTSELVDLIKSKGIYLSSQLQRAHAYLKQNLPKKVIPSFSDINRVLDQGVANKIVTPLKFNTKFAQRPFSHESIEYIYNTVTLGAIRAQKIYPGNTDEIYIIGRKMGNLDSGVVGVKQYRQALIKAGYPESKIKIFDSKEVNSLIDEMSERSLDLGRHLSLDELKNTPIWKLNEDFIKSAIGSGHRQPTIIDLGRLQSDTISYFYDGLELIELNKSRRTLWNPNK